jgi:hypothetical protein
MLEVPDKHCSHEQQANPDRKPNKTAYIAAEQQEAGAGQAEEQDQQQNQPGHERIEQYGEHRAPRRLVLRSAVRT